jgi:hypothetical protein
MLAFPILKTGSAVQYPFEVTQSGATDVLQFLAGDEQRYLTSPGPLRKWKIQLELLDEAEMKSIEAFFVAASGSFETFQFTDPSTGTSHPNCFISSDVLREEIDGELNTGLTILIQEGRA